MKKIFRRILSAILALSIVVTVGGTGVLVALALDPVSVSVDTAYSSLPVDAFDDGGSVTIDNGAVLTIEDTDGDLTCAGELNVNGVLSIETGASLTITGVMNITGSITLADGAELINNGTLNLSGAASAGDVSGDGDIFVTDTFTGSITLLKADGLDAGTLIASADDGANISAASFTVKNTADGIYEIEKELDGAAGLIKIATHTLVLDASGAPLIKFNGYSHPFGGAVKLNGVTIALAELAANHITLNYLEDGQLTSSTDAPIQAGVYHVTAVWDNGVNDPLTSVSVDMTILPEDPEPSPADRYAVTGYHTKLSQIKLPDGWAWNYPSPSAVALHSNLSHEVFEAENGGAAEDVTVRYVSFPLATGYKDGELFTFTKRTAAYSLAGTIAPKNAGGVTYNISWSSDNSDVFTVTGENLTARGAGMAALTATVYVTRINGETVRIKAAEYSFPVLVRGSGSTVNSAKELSAILTSGAGVYNIGKNDSDRIAAIAYAVENLPDSQSVRMTDPALNELNYLLDHEFGDLVEIIYSVDYHNSLSSKEKLELGGAGWLLSAAGVDGIDDPKRIELVIEQDKNSSASEPVFTVSLLSDVSGRMKATEPATPIWLDIELPSSYEHNSKNELVLTYDRGQTESLDYSYSKTGKVLSFRTDMLGEFEMEKAASSSSGTVTPAEPSKPSEPVKPETNYNTGGPTATEPAKAPVSPAETVKKQEAASPAVQVQAAAKPYAPISVSPASAGSGVSVKITADDIMVTAGEHRETILAAVVVSFAITVVTGSALFFGSSRRRRV